MNAWELISEEIAFWESTEAYYKDFFGLKKIRKLVELCELAIRTHPNKGKLVVDFISGLALIPIIKTKDKQQEAEFNRRIKPVLDILIERVGSDEYQKVLIDEEIAGDEIFKIIKKYRANNGTTIKTIEKTPITKKEILLHINRTNAFPLSLYDIGKIKTDFKEYLKKQSFGNNTQQSGINSIQVNAPVIALFCNIVNECKLISKEENESVEKYCERICKLYKLNYTDRVRQNFNGSNTKKNRQKVIEQILTTIDKEDSKKINEYLNTKNTKNQKLYG